MPSCGRCLGLGWYAAPKEEGDMGDCLIRCAPCPATGNRVDDPRPLFEFGDEVDASLEEKLDRWNDAVVILDGLTTLFEVERKGFHADGANTALTDAYNRAKVMAEYYFQQVEMRKVYADHKASG